VSIVQLRVDMLFVPIMKRQRQNSRMPDHNRFHPQRPNEDMEKE
jgi:hypothetical protein